MNDELLNKAELVVRSYERTLDKEMAYQKAGLTNSEKDVLDNDEEFQKRLQVFLIDEKENLIISLRRLSSSDNEKIALQATMELIKNIYPEFMEKRAPIRVKFDGSLSSEEKERVQEEYSRLIGNNGDVFISREE